MNEIWEGLVAGFWLVVTLVVIFLVLSRIALPRIAAVLAERQGTITNDLAAAEDLKRKAEEAERAGLVSRVVPAKKLMDEAMAAAAKISEKSAITVMAVKEAVNRAYETPLREGLLFERRLFHALFATEDQKEGMSAFLEKREAQFRDK